MLLRPLCLGTLCLTLALGTHSSGEPVRVTVRNEILHTVDPRLFGQFLERPSWGETGPEAAVNESGQLPPPIVARLREMDIPVVRFPGGTDIDYINWTDMVSNIPGRSAARPLTTGHTDQTVSNRFGYDEYLRLAHQLGWESILVVNLLDAVGGKVPIEAAALHAAGLLAYCNAPVGAVLSPGMPDWPSIRARNGHPEPYAVKYFQLGNETWLGRFKREALAQFPEGDKAALATRYREAVKAYIRAMKAVDARIQIIMDLKQPGELGDLVLADPYLRANVAFVANHIYAPMGVDRKTFGPGQRGREPVGMSAEEWEYALNSMPGDYNEAGQNIGFGDQLALARTLGYEVAVTEWNWNGFGFNRIVAPLDFDRNQSAAVGVAGFLNGMLRQADQIKLATQSMLIGHGWGIAAIHYDQQSLEPVYFNAQGAVTTLYQQNHGASVLAVDLENAPVREQPYMLGVASAPGKISTIDVLATRGPGCLYLHLVNRDPVQPTPLEINLSACPPVAPTGTLLALQRVPPEAIAANGASLNRVETTIALTGPRVTIELPPSSLAILKIPVAPGTGTP